MIAKTTSKSERVEAVRLVPGSGDDQLCIDTIFSVISHPSVYDTLCDECRRPSYIVRLIDEWRAGIRHCAAVMVDGKVVGLFHGAFMNGGIFEGYQCMARTEGARVPLNVTVTALSVCTKMVFEELNAERVWGFISVEKLGSQAVARRAGFREIGLVKNYASYGGKKVNSYIVEKENENAP